MDRLIPIINKLQDVFKTVREGSLDLPQIVVIGNQSSGKSSLIESIVGREFLPRGSGIVTRRPLILQLIHLQKESCPYRKQENGTMYLNEWAQFEHLGKKIFTDFLQVRDEIEEETARLSGNNKGICPEPIILKVFSTTVVTLTLVDLPGFTKIPVGDQPENIEETIHDLIMQYIRNENAIILAVTAANTDITTSEALKFAKKVDPTGDRTLAVLTKLDIMDAGLDAYDLLQGDVIQVKKGIIGIVNRSQKDINDKKSVEESLKFEAEFFEQNYPLLAKRNGTPYLCKVLSHLLMNHIKKCLPKLKAQVSSQISECQRILKQYGEPINDKKQTMLGALTEFDKRFTKILEGSPAVDELTGAARISFIFKQTFGHVLESIDALGGLSNKEILTAIENAKGLGSSKGIMGAFELLIKRQIEKLEEPSIRCVELVYGELERISKCCNESVSVIVRFPKLEEAITDVVFELLKSRLEPTVQMIRNLINIEIAYIDPYHPDMIDTNLDTFIPSIKKPNTFPMAIQNGTDEFAQIAGDIISVDRKLNSDYISREFDQKAVSEKNQVAVNMIKVAIKNYYLVIRKKLQDSVPKAIMHFLVNYVKHQLGSELVSKLYSAHYLEELFEEAPNVAEKRKGIEQQLAALTKASEIINEVNYYKS